MSKEQKMSSWGTRNIAPQEHILSTQGTRNNASGEQLSSHKEQKN
jgi:hypothetical protein